VSFNRLVRRLIVSSGDSRNRGAGGPSRWQRLQEDHQASKTDSGQGAGSHRFQLHALVHAIHTTSLAFLRSKNLRRCLVRMQIKRSPTIAALATSTDQIKREVAIRFAKGRAFAKQMSTHRNLISNHAESSGARRSKLIFCEWVRGGSHLHPFVAGGRCNVCLSYFENQRNLVWRVVAISGERAAYRFNERRGRPGSFGVKRSPSRQLRHDSPR
jgi:hypothetical protein